MNSPNRLPRGLCLGGALGLFSAMATPDASLELAKVLLDFPIVEAGISRQGRLLRIEFEARTRSFSRADRRRHGLCPGV
jgi:hypothetical protein